MPIPTGSWKITAGSEVGTLTFTGNTGSVSGTLVGTPFVGFFDETSQTLTMLSNPHLSNPTGFQNVLATPFTVYQGTLFHFTPAGSSSQVSVLTGGFYNVTGANPLAYTTWFAQNPAPVKTAKEGKDGKDGKDHKDKDKDHKDVPDKTSPPDKLPEAPVFSGLAAAAFALAQHAAAPEAGLAVGQSFIEASERPTVGESALQG